MSVWFEQDNEIACSIEHVKASPRDLGEQFVGVVTPMPGLTTVSLVDQGDDHVTIETFEGLMKRTNIVRNLGSDRVVLEFDEEYKAGSKVNATSHHRSTFVAGDSGVNHHLVVSDVQAPGFLGFFYRRFGSSNIGKAILASYKTNLEQ
jgi:hypothetical protein